MTSPFRPLRGLYQRGCRYVSYNPRKSTPQSPKSRIDGPIPPHPPQHGIVSQLFGAIVTATQFLLFGHVVTTYIIDAHPCAGPSMMPTLSVYGDYVAIARWYRRGRGIRVGDMVDFAHPTIPGVGAIKRVIGMPGDFVVDDRYVDENGEELDQLSEDSLEDDMLPVRVKEKKMVQVPEGHCWILGDNLAESRDSRTYGPLPLALIKGKVFAKVLPWREKRWFENTLEQPELEG